ncbi:TPA: DNA-directed RNA polymerase subunit L [Candidatus Woesearchaeota archaeon]|nr:DNA-directed RNA polymerase subunit L [Candidatus Woesearchaeota archaeon]
MEITILESKKHRIVFELRGADHTFCNALKQELWNDESVKIAAYNIDHPLVGVPKFVVESSADAKEALLGASSRLQKRNKDFLAAFEKL